MRSLLHGLPVAALLAMVPPDAWPAALAVTPTRLELAPGDRVATVTLQNNAEAPVTVQVQTFAWPRTPATGDLDPTRDLIAIPPLFSLEPNGRQIIRVALRGPLEGAQERAYRLLITEVPEPAGRAGGMGVKLALRLSLPVFVTPAGAAPQPVWAARPEAGELVLGLSNRGTAHLQVRRIALHARGRPEPVQVIENPAYVLPGQEQLWPLSEAARGQATLQLQAETSLGPIEASLVLPPR